MIRQVLDASAVLAWLQQETGADRVDPWLAAGVVSAPNWSEFLQKAAQNGRDSDETDRLLKALGVQATDLTEADALRAASLWLESPTLSLADRCCLALAQRLNVPIVTADRAWSDLSVGLQIIVIR